MRLANLRARMLIAIGLPACWTGSPPASQPPPPPVVKANLGFEGSSCVRDSIPESVCGERRETARSCGAKAASLASVEESKLHITEEDDSMEAYREFTFDREETRRFRDEHSDATSRISYCCYSQCTAMTVGKADPVALTGGRTLDTRCMPAPPNGTSQPAQDDRACPEGVAIEGVLRPYVSTEDGECCYSIPVQIFQMHSIPGRALRIDGVPRVAEVAARSGWTTGITPNLELPIELRDRLARAWVEIAQLEHASVAAFAALALRLLAAGAPVSLIARAHEAALDEVRHAQIAFALASLYAGTQLGPGRFEAVTRASTDGDLRSLALETFADGCIGETAAAHQAELAAAAAQDPVVATALAGIAEDEARHGALAWSIVAWCVRGGAVTVEELLTITAGACARAGDSTDDLAAHGVLGDRAAAAARADVLRDVVVPCLHALAA